MDCSVCNNYINPLKDGFQKIEKRWEQKEYITAIAVACLAALAAVIAGAFTLFVLSPLIFRTIVEVCLPESGSSRPKAEFADEMEEVEKGLKEAKETQRENQAKQREERKITIIEKAFEDLKNKRINVVYNESKYLVVVNEKLISVSGYNDDCLHIIFKRKIGDYDYEYTKKVGWNPKKEIPAEILNIIDTAHQKRNTWGSGDTEQSNASVSEGDFR